MAKAFSKNKQNSGLNLVQFKSMFDDGKSPLFEKCSSPEYSSIICQEVFFKKSRKKKEQNRLLTLVLTDEFLFFPKVFPNK